MITCIIASAGSGKRFGGMLPKQFIKLGQETVLETAVRKFQENEKIDRIICVCPETFLNETRILLTKFSKVTDIVAGGKERQDSVYNGLKLVDDGIVLVHDGARPFVSKDVIDRVIEKSKTVSSVPGVKVKDTIRTQGGNLNRDELFSVQTPQGFHVDILKKALNTEECNITLNFDTNENQINITGYIDDLKQDTWHGISLGGGAISIKEFDCGEEKEIYKENNFTEIKEYIRSNNIDLLTYAYSHEPDLKEYLLKCLEVMFDVVNRGLNTEGLLNKDLNYYRVAKKLYSKCGDKKDFLVAYSYAASEENAAGGLMCTAPTLGACGILTSLMYYLMKMNH